ncbi:MAG: hypothetical protein SFU25_04415 [Candidatus Caenarcaniphilales bacterium]|nr:hypothetical protein [Candidatus Caenarcaniphilales bacterium]
MTNNSQNLNFSFKSLALLLVFIFSFCQNLCSKAESPQEEKVYKSQTAVGKYQKIGTLSPVTVKPVSVKKINTIETTTENATEAVILIPGLNSVSLAGELYEWKHFLETFKRSKINQDTKDKFEFYVFRYNGWDSLYNSSRTLAKGLKQLLEEEKNIKTISIIGYSQGGIIPRILMVENPDLEQKIRKVVTTAAPHLGTPSLTRQITADCVAIQPPIIRSKNFIALNLFINRYKYAYREQAWSDFDKAMPPSAKYQPPQEILNLPVPENLNKYITYASYYFPLYANDFETSFSILFGEVIPRSFLDRRAGMKELNRWMTKKIYPDEEPRLRQNLRLNDGVTPLSSGLWTKLCETNEEQPCYWHKLFPNNNYCPRTGLQRAFYGADHLMWREKTSGSKLVKDELHPEEESKSIYDWIIEDLVEGF